MCFALPPEAQHRNKHVSHSSAVSKANTVCFKLCPSLLGTLKLVHLLKNIFWLSRQSCCMLRMGFSLTLSLLVIIYDFIQQCAIIVHILIKKRSLCPVPHLLVHVYVNICCSRHVIVRWNSLDYAYYSYTVACHVLECLAYSKDKKWCFQRLS